MHDQNLTELATRRNDRLEVTLFWAPADGSVHVTVLNERTGSTVSIPVERSRALDAFYHPFAYAA
jgi:hypothetical protein